MHLQLKNNEITNHLQAMGLSPIALQQNLNMLCAHKTAQAINNKLQEIILRCDRPEYIVIFASLKQFGATGGEQSPKTEASKGSNNEVEKIIFS